MTALLLIVVGASTCVSRVGQTPVRACTCVWEGGGSNPSQGLYMCIRTHWVPVVVHWVHVGIHRMPVLYTGYLWPYTGCLWWYTGLLWP